MTTAQFKAWRAHMGMTQRAAAAALGIARPTLELYERGSRHEDGRKVVIPKPIELACAALALGISNYDGPKH